MPTLPSAPPFRTAVTAARRPRVGQRLAVVTVAYAFVVTMVATTVPSPLYGLYRQQFGFSELMVTVIFAIYGFGVVAALLLFGRLSDEIGRRTVLLGGLLLAAAGMTAFLFAEGVPLLLVGRFLSGLAAGLLSGAATAALIDLTPPARRARATLVSTIAQMGGLGVGPLLAGVVATWIAAPLRTPFWIVLVLLVVAILGVWALPDSDHTPRRLRLRPQPSRCLRRRERPSCAARRRRSPGSRSSGCSPPCHPLFWLLSSPIRPRLSSARWWRPCSSPPRSVSCSWLACPGLLGW